MNTHFLVHFNDKWTTQDISIESLLNKFDCTYDEFNSGFNRFDKSFKFNFTHSNESNQLILNYTLNGKNQKFEFADHYFVLDSLFKSFTTKVTTQYMIDNFNKKDI